MKVYNLVLNVEEEVNNDWPIKASALTTYRFDKADLDIFEDFVYVNGKQYAPEKIHSIYFTGSWEQELR